eukprot:7744175-Pyramimonas_sp.AAC.1
MCLGVAFFRHRLGIQFSGAVRRRNRPGRRPGRRLGRPARAPARVPESARKGSWAPGAENQYF